MNCPRCLTPLAASEPGSLGAELGTLDCRNCTGHWLEADALSKAEQVVDIQLVEWRHLPGIETQGRILFCPRCPGPKPMDKVVSARDSRVVMDVCPACRGVWLDYGELEAIQQKGLLSAIADVFKFFRST